MVHYGHDKFKKFEVFFLIKLGGFFLSSYQKKKIDTEKEWKKMKNIELIT